ncbi:MAG: UvrD-helicase domain-containing protein, partial [Hyphomicrobiaceae bacterium]
MTGRHDDPAPQHDPAALRTATKKAQGDASDPAASAWVSANAGAGKTHVLKQRVLRILLSGTPPARILCLTYTRAAAAEMQTRVFKDLSMWATTSAEVLEHELRENVLGRPPRPEEMADARNLFARAIETPGGLKVQTIHAFCERLLQRFPLEAGVPAGFSILDDTEGAGLRREATDAVLSQAARDRQSPLGQALACMIAFADGAGFDDVLTSALSKRDWLASMRLTIDASDGDDAAESVYRRALGIRSRGSRAEIEHEMAAVMSDADMRRAAGALSEGGKNDAKL